MISTVTKLEDSEILQGGAVTIEVEYLDMIGNTTLPADITSYSCYFVLYPYGQEDYITFQKQCSLTPGTVSKMSVLLTNEDTSEWQGAFTFEFVLKDTNGDYIKNNRGTLHVLKSKINAT